MNFPLITVVVSGYQQEGCIRDAVQSAFDQTYEPLEIILSDDCSTDRTFEIMKEMAANYRGPHKVVLNRQKFNSFMSHYNTLLSMANGEYFATFDGDDISLPNRVSRLYEVIKENPRVVHVYSNAYTMSEQGEDIGLMNREDATQKVSQNMAGWEFFPKSLGCVQMYHRASCLQFGTFHVPRIFDQCAVFRGNLVGEVFYLNEPLIRYRVHSKSQSGPVEEFDYEKRIALLARRYHDYFLCWRQQKRDLELALSSGWIEKKRYDAINKKLIARQCLALAQTLALQARLGASKYHIFTPLTASCKALYAFILGLLFGFRIDLGRLIRMIEYRKKKRNCSCSGTTK